MARNARRWTGWGIAGVLLLGLAAMVVGTMGKTASSTFSQTGTTVYGNDIAAPRSAAVSGGTTAVAGPVPAAAPNVSGADAAALPSIPDRIARTADLTVEVKKGLFDSAWSRAFQVSQRFGGQIMSSTRGAPNPQPVPLQQGSVRSSSDNGPAFGDITMRIPAGSFAAATNMLRGLGTVRGDNTTTEDVSQEYVDLQSRLRNLRAEQNVMLALFDRAKTIRDTLTVQAQLSNVEGQIEQITGRIKYLDARTVFSTVTIHLQEPGVITTLTPASNPSFGRAWETAKTGLVRIAGASLILGLWLGPFAVIALIGFALWRRVRGPAPQV